MMSEQVMNLKPEQSVKVMTDFQDSIKSKLLQALVASSVKASRA